MKKNTLLIFVGAIIIILPMLMNGTALSVTQPNAKFITTRSGQEVRDALIIIRTSYRQNSELADWGYSPHVTHLQPAKGYYATAWYRSYNPDRGTTEYYAANSIWFSLGWSDKLQVYELKLHEVVLHGTQSTRIESMLDDPDNYFSTEATEGVDEEVYEMPESPAETEPMMVQEVTGWLMVLPLSTIIGGLLIVYGVAREKEWL